MKKMIFVFGLIFFLSGAAQAQSTLEYTALTTGVAAAAAKVKKGNPQNQDQENSQASSSGYTGLVEGTMSKIYGDADQAMASKSASLLGQAGAPLKAPAADGLRTESAPAQNLPDKKTSVPSISAGPGSVITLYLNSGQSVKGKLVEQTRDYIKIDIEGVTTTYFSDEIGGVK